MKTHKPLPLFDLPLPSEASGVVPAHELYPSAWAIGVDEAGRGCLAGPVVAGAVLFSPGFDPAKELPGLNDSKKLREKQRNALAPEIRKHAVYGLGFSWPAEIDRINILNATFRAMSRAILSLMMRARRAGLDVEAHPALSLLIDGNHRIRPDAWQACCDKKLPPQQAVIGGDALVPSISAASILAKTTRDGLMTRLDHRFSGYGFAGHKGYGTAEHLAALAAHGPCPLHRKSFRKVKPEEEQLSLF